MNCVFEMVRVLHSEWIDIVREGRGEVKGKERKGKGRKGKERKGKERTSAHSTSRNYVPN